MTKDIEWMKEEIGELPCVDTVFNSDGSSYIDSAVPVMAVYDLLDQLDEPEVLSQEFINEKTVEVYADTADAEVHVVFRMRDLQNLLVPKQELPVIPKFVADWIEETKPYNSLRVAFEYIAQRKRGNHDDELAFWVEEGNSETFARAWLDGYTVEEEQEYYVINTNHRMMLVRMMDGKTITEADPFPLGELYDGERKSHRLTEQEIKDYDERYWPFAVKVEELEE